jgi:hypothetical protein
MKNASLAPAAESALSAAEIEALTKAETTIDCGLKTFVMVGRALCDIRDGKLYREKFKTFEDYCREKWDIDRTYAYRLIGASEASENLLPIGNILPTNEAQARPLTSLPPEQQREAWKEAVASSPTGKPTAAQVEAAAVKVTGKPAKAKPAPAPIDPEPDYTGGSETPAYEDESQEPEEDEAWIEADASPKRQAALARIGQVVTGPGSRAALLESGITEADLIELTTMGQDAIGGIVSCIIEDGKTFQEACAAIGPLVETKAPAPTAVGASKPSQEQAALNRLARILPPATIKAIKAGVIKLTNAELV